MLKLAPKETGRFIKLLCDQTDWFITLSHHEIISRDETD